MGMATGPGGSTTSVREQAEAFTTAVYIPVLRNLRLTGEAIAAQNLEELEASLDRVNDAIAHSTEFGTFSFELTMRSGKIFLVASAGAQAVVTVSILPLLLDAKTLIVDRIREIRPREQLNSLRNEVVQVVENPAERERINQLFEERQQANAERQRQAAHEAVQNAMREARLSQELREKQERLNLEIMARRSEIRRSYLSRDTVAGAIGPILLLLLGISLIIAMFVHTTVSGTVSDSFLLILGYFFGNAATQKSARSGKRKRAEDPEPEASAEMISTTQVG